MMRSIELFAGAGGLALGTSRAGFKHEAIVEWDADACATIHENRRRRIRHVGAWPDVTQADIKDLDFRQYKPDVDLLSGGVPCQPWSQGGLHKGFDDNRNMFPDMLRAVRALTPKAILVENVKGLQRRVFTNYFEYIKLQIEYPEVEPKAHESWVDHLSRLQRHHTSKKSDGLRYKVVAQLLNAADYGVPQRRERVFIVAFRFDVAPKWTFPEPTHSLLSLLRQQHVTGEYWERHAVPKKHRTKPSAVLLARASSLPDLFERPTDPWRTVRDAIGDLPDPELMPREADQYLNHKHNPGARAYPGHTGSPMDLPSKTLKAGVHGVPGGENTLANRNGSVRYFTVRESARIQTFPDDFVFQASWTESMRQLGNAVPVRLAELIARDISRHLKKAND
ncbi:MAG TPA: DNA cytosine methyltransferase [Vicinamibacterales bacterium]|nr:DNA cytosine methyltransferase [Vicinamibacterales bacterium]